MSVASSGKGREWCPTMGVTQTFSEVQPFLKFSGEFQAILGRYSFYVSEMMDFAEKRWEICRKMPSLLSPRPLLTKHLSRMYSLPKSRGLSF